MKKGLVLEGGALRGLFSAGVIDVLMENGIAFDGAIGVSAGAAFGCNYKSGQIGRVIRYQKRFIGDKRYRSFSSLIKTGDLFNAEFCYHTVPDELDIFDGKAFEASPMEFYVVAADIETGEAVYRKCEKAGHEFLEWIRASASLPLAANIVEIGGQKLMDGGLIDSIPIRFFESIGYDKNLVVLTQPRGFVKEKNKMLPILRLVMKKYPKLIDAVARRHDVYNATTEYIFEQEKKGNCFVICPDEPLGISIMEKDTAELDRVYMLGRKAAEKNLTKLKEYFLQV